MSERDDKLVLLRPGAGAALAEPLDDLDEPPVSVWVRMRRDYVHGDETLDAIAARYDKNPSYTRRVAGREGWGTDRRTLRRQLDDELDGITVQQRRDALERYQAQALQMLSEGLAQQRRDLLALRPATVAEWSAKQRALNDLADRVAPAPAVAAGPAVRTIEARPFAALSDAELDAAIARARGEPVPALPEGQDD